MLDNKPAMLEFSNYSNTNTKIYNGDTLEMITANTALRLKSKEFVALKDNKSLIDDLILNKVIEEEQFGTIDQGGSNILVYKLTDWCFDNN